MGLEYHQSNFKTHQNFFLLALSAYWDEAKVEKVALSEQQNDEKSVAVNGAESNVEDESEDYEDIEQYDETELLNSDEGKEPSEYLNITRGEELIDLP